MSNKVKLTEVLKNKKSNTETINVDGVNVEVKRLISLKDMVEFVNFASSMCFNDEGGYTPWAKDFAIKKYIVEKYTNLELPSDVSECYSSIYGTGIVNEALRVIDQEQLGEIVNSVDEAVAYATKSNIELINAQMNKINNEFEKFSEKITTLFDGADPDEFKKMLNTVMAFGNVEDVPTVEK